MSKEEKIKELIGIAKLLEPITKLSLESTGCDKEYAGKHPLDYATMVNLYRDAVEEFLVKTINESIESEEMIDKILAMHQSEEYKILTETGEKIAKSGNPLLMTLKVAQSEKVPFSFLMHMRDKMMNMKRSSTDKIEDILEKKAIGRIEIKSPEELAQVLKQLKEVGAEPVGDMPKEILNALKGNPEDEIAAEIKTIEELINSVSSEVEECDCENCDADDCANREKPPKGSQLN